MWSPQVIVIVALSFSIVLCCDLQYRCNHGNYYVSNPEPQTYTYAKADGCETIVSIDKRFVLVRMCTKETVELELHAANGFNMTCNLSCAHSRHRRDKTWSPISMAELYEGGGIEDKACQYSCNNAGLYIDNPRPELYNFLRAYSLPDMIECQWDDPRDDNKILYVYGCPLEGMALIMFSKKSEEENVIERHQNMDIVDCGEFLPFEQPVKSGSDGDIDYDCYPNGTILAVNRRPELWKYGMAMNDQVPCEVIFFNNNKQLVILGCPQALFSDVFGEPDHVRTVDCTWVNSKKIFGGTHQYCYSFLSTLCGIPIAILWGLQYACNTFCMVWCCYPALLSMRHCLYHVQRGYSLCIRCLLDPCYSSFGLVLSKINVTIGKQSCPTKSGPSKASVEEAPGYE